MIIIKRHYTDSPFFKITEANSSAISFKEVGMILGISVANPVKGFLLLVYLPFHVNIRSHLYPSSITRTDFNIPLKVRGSTSSSFIIHSTSTIRPFDFITHLYPPNLLNIQKNIQNQ